MPNIPILILAAGASTRMRGRDKLLIDIGGTPLLRRTVQAALTTGQPVIVALPQAPHPRHLIVADLPVDLVQVADAASGMNASLRTGLAHLPDNADAVMILLADLPDLTAVDLATVLAAADFSEQKLIARGMTEDGKPGHPVIFSKRLFPELAQLAGDSGAQDVVRRHRGQVIQVPLPGQNARLDLDTPEDWADWQARHRL